MNLENEKWYQAGDNVNGQGILTAEREGNYVCLIPDADDEGQKARADLIEKAPQLLKVAEAVVMWWEQHRYDCGSAGEDGEYNLYDETPEFVTLSQRALGKPEDY